MFDILGPEGDDELFNHSVVETEEHRQLRVHLALVAVPVGIEFRRSADELGASMSWNQMRKGMQLGGQDCRDGLIAIEQRPVQVEENCFDHRATGAMDILRKP